MSSYSNGAMKQWLAKWGLVAVMLLVFCSFTVSSQEDRRSRRSRRNATISEQIDTQIVPELSDSLKAVRDSAHRADSIFKLDSADKLSTYTVMFDARVSNFNNYHPLLQTNQKNTDDGDLFINKFLYHFCGTIELTNEVKKASPFGRGGGVADGEGKTSPLTRYRGSSPRGRALD